MTEFVVLDDATVHDILMNQSKADVIAFKDELETSLRNFSVGTEGEFQPDPSAIVRPDGQKTLFRPFTSPTAVGTKLVVDPAPKPTTASDGSTVMQKAPLQGVVVLWDQNGLPSGIMNAEELTGFRTSLSALIPWFWRRNTDNIVVFGAGKQALWHIRLALATRGEDIRSVTIVNRSLERGQALLKTLQEENDSRWKTAAEIALFDLSPTADYDQRLKTLLSNADAIFCTVPSTKPLFPTSAVVGDGRKKGDPFISAIGSWTPDMTELEPELLRDALKARPGFHPSGDVDGGVIIADDCKEAMIKAGEIVNSGLVREQLLELGQIIQWRQDPSALKPSQKEGFTKWLEEGFVILKAVGVSVTDLACGDKILQLAKERQFGTIIPHL